MQAFEHFGPLLQVSADYAQRSGFRFRSSDFRDLETVQAKLVSLPPEDARVEEANFAARMRAKPMVCHFAARLRAGDPWLAQELERAVHMQMLEGVRNAMICACRELAIFPPPASFPAPEEEGERSADAESPGGALEDVSAPLEVIARRLYLGGTVSSDPSRAMTASFLADFASQEGAALPDTSEAFQTILEEFAARVSEWKAQQATTAQARSPAEGQGTRATKFGSADAWQELLVQTSSLSEDLEAALRSKGAGGWATALGARADLVAGAFRQEVRDWTEALSWGYKAPG
jgi:hypothetical protein